MIAKFESTRFAGAACLLQRCSEASARLVSLALAFGIFAAPLAVLAAGARNASSSRDGATTNQARGLDFSAFKIIADRNIFNPRRYARSKNSDRRDTRRAARVDAVTLVGTMQYEKGPFAFFDGTSSSYRKVLQTGDSIACFKVDQINGKGVTLSSGTNHLDLTVGSQLRREDGGDWRLVGPMQVAAESYSRPSSGPPPVTVITRTITVPVTNTAPAEPPVIILDSGANGTDGQPVVLAPPAETDQVQPPPPPGGEETPPDEVLRRLMERREQEINR